MDIFAKKNHHQKGVQYLILGKERHLFLLFFLCSITFGILVSAWLGLFELMTKTLNVELDVIPTVFYCYHLDLEYVQKEVKKKKKENIRSK